MKKNVTYKLKNQYADVDFIYLGSIAVKTESISQEQLATLYLDKPKYVEIVGKEQTNTYDEKKKKK